VRAPLFIVQRALPLLRDGGRIVDISSGVTSFATPEVVYGMTAGHGCAPAPGARACG
jgi:NAD(P)-dependent dehydrogenase (short-subunit alcohol dehydrogenase family)